MLPLLLLSHLQTTFSAQCLGIAFEGGGARGSFEAGAFSVLTNTSNNINVRYNIMTGISIGAMTSGIMSGFPIGQELGMSSYLNNFWFGVKNNSQFYVEWEGGLIDGLLFQRGLYNNAPGIEYLRSYFHAPVRNITVGSTNLDTGLFENFNESLGGALFDGCVSSGSLPGLFPPHLFEGYAWADGACVMNLDVASAIERCLTVTTEDQIVIDILFDEFAVELPSETSFKSVQVLERAYDIHKLDTQIWYIRKRCWGIRWWTLGTWCTRVSH